MLPPDSDSAEQLPKPEPEARWMLRKNCSLGPQALLAIFGSMVLVSLVVAGAWAAHGAWIVLPFAVVECLALAVAFLVYARHATDADEVEFFADRIRVVAHRGSRQRELLVPREWVRIGQPESDQGLIEIRSGAQRAWVGRFVEPSARRQLAKEMRQQLSGAAMASPARG